MWKYRLTVLMTSRMFSLVGRLMGIVWLTILPPVAASDLDSRLYEMRVYYAADGKLDALHQRFREHTLKLFEKHGMTNIGYWTPIENPDSKLVYFLAYPDKQSRDTSWKSFMSDPDWQTAWRESELDGKLVAKIETTFLQATDFSPKFEPDSKGQRTFELRTYQATPGNLDALQARFREHTVQLFEKHGMTNIAYWIPIPEQKAMQDTLIYILAHDSREAARTSFASFRNDPAWAAARAESERRAGGSLTMPEGGVQSEFLVATDYSPIR